MKSLHSCRHYLRSTSADIPPRTSSVRGFSLIEVVMALGIVSFSMLAIMGVLPLGLSTLQDSVNQTATAIISQQIRSELQQVSFDSTVAFNITQFDTTSSGYYEYYTYDGVKTVQANRFYTASFVLSDPNVSGASFKPGDTLTFGSISNAKNVTVTLNYPGSVNSPIRFSILAAKQTSK